MVVRGTTGGRRPSRFTGARVVVTGASRGIGREIAASFAGEGASVVILDRLIDDARDMAATIGGHAVECDLADADSTIAAMHEAIQHLQGVDILVNNAGVFKITPLLDISPDEWDWIFSVNVRAML